jgi:hypothetical protein
LKEKLKGKFCEGGFAMSQLMAEARQRIDRIRQKTVEVVVLKGDSPLPGAEVALNMQRHDFLFGCNCFRVHTFTAPEEETRHRELFAGLFNYATLPFYWDQYEPAPGRKEEARLAALAAWCRDAGTTVKGHPLVWNTPWKMYGGCASGTPGLAGPCILRRLRC